MLIRGSALDLCRRVLPFQYFEHIFRVAFGFDLVEDVRDLAVRANKKRGALDAHHLFAVHVLFFDYAVGFADLLVRVG